MKTTYLLIRLINLNILKPPETTLILCYAIKNFKFR